MIANNPPFGTARSPHRYSAKVRKWMKQNPDKPLKWSYFDFEGVTVYVTDLPLNHPVRH